MGWAFLLIGAAFLFSAVRDGVSYYKTRRRTPLFFALLALVASGWMFYKAAAP
jgi:hypothetical protein